MIDNYYVLFNKKNNTFFGGFSMKNTSFFDKAKRFYDLNYANRFMFFYGLNNDFDLFSNKQVSKVVLYA